MYPKMCFFNVDKLGSHLYSGRDHLPNFGPNSTFLKRNHAIGRTNGGFHVRYVTCLLFIISFVNIFSSSPGAMLNLILIMMLGRVYEKLALRLTSWGELFSYCT